MGPFLGPWGLVWGLGAGALGGEDGWGLIGVGALWGWGAGWVSPISRSDKMVDRRLCAKRNEKGIPQKLKKESCWRHLVDLGCHFGAH